MSSPNVEEMIERRDPLFAAKPAKNPNPNKEETTIERRDPLFDEIPGVAARIQRNFGG